MARKFAMAFYHSDQWERCRNSYMRMPIKTEKGVCNAGLCERCYAHGVIEPAEIVHHIEHVQPWNINDPNVTLSFDNLMRVCRKCHGELHGFLQDDSGRRVDFDEEGNVKERRANG